MGTGQRGDNAIQRAGFVINPAKTRLQYRISRQLVTGLTVNAKVNIRSEYYRWARAMCHSLFKTGAYHRPTPATPVESQVAGEKPETELVTSLGPLEGILSHIHHVKDSIDGRTDSEKKKDATAARKLYIRFLKYRYFVRLERPLIICEGKTDNVYLKFAIRKLSNFHPKLGFWDGAIFTSAVAFFNYGNKAHRLLQLGGGTSDLRYFFIKSKGHYQKDLQSFKHRPLKHPVIVLIDNDDGAKEIFSILKSNYSITVDLKSPDPFFHVTENLYLVKTPERGQDGVSCIENFFEASLLETELEGKKFNPKKDHDADGEYGKFVFAEKVVRPNADKIAARSHSRGHRSLLASRRGGYGIDNLPAVFQTFFTFHQTRITFINFQQAQPSDSDQLSPSANSLRSFLNDRFPCADGPLLGGLDCPLLAEPCR